ncbi:MAG: hypothetical protein WC393_02440 [Candidatus Nanoarchaeia archaeon]|jgi:hypothetical protein
MEDLSDIYCIDIKLKNLKEHELSRKKVIALSETVGIDSILYINPEHFMPNSPIIPFVQYLNFRNKAHLSTYIQLKHNENNSNEIFSEFEKKLITDIKGLDYELSIKREYEGIIKSAFEFNSNKSFSSKIKLPAINNYDLNDTEKIKLTMAFLCGMLSIAITCLAVEKFFKR